MQCIHFASMSMQAVAFCIHVTAEYSLMSRCQCKRYTTLHSDGKRKANSDGERNADGNGKRKANGSGKRKANGNGKHKTATANTKLPATKDGRQITTATQWELPTIRQGPQPLPPLGRGGAHVFADLS